MPLKKILKSMKVALQIENDKKPKTILGTLLHKLKINSMEGRIANIQNELIKRKTNKV